LLIQRNGQPFNPGGRVELFQSSPGAVMQSPWGWRQHGQCGKWVSDLLPHLATCVDDIAFLPAMVSRSNVHGPATCMQNTAFVRPGFPTTGGSANSARGGLTESLPPFVVLPDSRGFAPNGPANWSAGFLPASFQGTMIRPSDRNPIFDLFPSANNYVTPDAERDGLRLLQQMNRRHQESRPGDSRLDPGTQMYDLAPRLQLRAPEVLDFPGKPQEPQRFSGLDRPITAEFGRNCLIGRRLLERGVRFVQIWSGADNGFPRRNWDSHENLERDHGDMGTSMDQPAAALIKDLKQRGLLEDT